MSEQAGSDKLAWGIIGTGGSPTALPAPWAPAGQLPRRSPAARRPRRTSSATSSASPSATRAMTRSGRPGPGGLHLPAEPPPRRVDVRYGRANTSSVKPWPRTMPRRWSPSGSAPERRVPVDVHVPLPPADAPWRTGSARRHRRGARHPNRATVCGPPRERPPAEPAAGGGIMDVGCYCASMAASSPERRWAATPPGGGRQGVRYINSTNRVDGGPPPVPFRGHRRQPDLRHQVGVESVVRVGLEGIVVTTLVPGH